MKWFKDGLRKKLHGLGEDMDDPNDHQTSAERLEEPLKQWLKDIVSQYMGDPETKMYDNCRKSGCRT